MLTLNEYLAIIFAFLIALAFCPLGFMFGSPCTAFCSACQRCDGKLRTDPAIEGTWIPSGTWASGVTWTYQGNPGDESGETWFFYGSSQTSTSSGFATITQQQDWGNICNWYSNKTTAPSVTTGLPGDLNRRALRLPPTNAVVHIYSSVSTSSTGPVSVKNAYFWSGQFQPATFLAGSEMETSSAAHDSVAGCVFSAENKGAINNGATFINLGNNGISGVINDGAVFWNTTTNLSTVNGGATMHQNSDNDELATINGAAVFFDSSRNDGTCNNGATFHDLSFNSAFGVIDQTGVFNDSSKNQGVVNDGATFNGSSENLGTVNDGAVFNNSSINEISGTVNSGATFNDAACSRRSVGAASLFPPPPCTKKWVAHPTDLPTCNGTAPEACANPFATCGCN